MKKSRSILVPEWPGWTGAFISRAITYSCFLMIVTPAFAEDRCGKCHAAEVAAYERSPMARSISSTPGVFGNAAFEHAGSKSRLAVHGSSGSMVHQIDGPQLRGSFPVAYQVGAGLVGESFIISMSGALFQSPLSHYTKRGWDLTPGYETQHVLDFSHPITADCLFCHTNQVNLKPHTRNSYATPAFTSISCERCHGSAEAHLARPVRGTIVNPARLGVRERDSVCEQCHLHTSLEILNSGKDWWDFKPGEALEEVATYYFQGKSKGVQAVGHVEQLAQSACALKSGGKLWCGSCHDPHGPAVDMNAKVKQVCQSCHGETRSANHPHKAVECSSCHMPKRGARDVAHAAITDHLIGRRAAEVAVPAAVASWQPAKPEFQNRNLGLAYLGAYEETHDPNELRRGYELLKQANLHPNDSAGLAALGSVMLGMKQTRLAVGLYRQAAASAPGNPEYIRFLAEAEAADGETAEAIRQLERAIELDPYDRKSYVALAHLYHQTGHKKERSELIERYAKLTGGSQAEIGDR